MITSEHRLEAEPFIRRWCLDLGQVAKRSQNIHQIDIPQRTLSWLHTGSFNDKRHSPRVLIEILFALQAVAANRHTMI